jgi:hypothetical protein
VIEQDPARTDRRIIATCGVLLLIIAMAAMWRAAFPPWDDAQAQVREVVAERIDAAKAATLPEGLQQIWIPELHRVDRCVSCHTAMDFGEALEDAPNPARSHPARLQSLFAAHPVEKFGCTLCHGGQGQATTVEAAHGKLPHWEETLLDAAVAGRYGLTRAELMELRCAMCHQTLDPVEGMPFLNPIKDKLFDCIDCHQIPDLEPSRPPTAPDLTHEGEKHPTKIHFPEDWQGDTTALRWHIEHFMNPQKMTPGSAMGRFAANPKEAAALALLVLSWRREHLPPAWIPKK